jgi:carbon-monoxide dehydrogenase small subunit
MNRTPVTIEVNGVTHADLVDVSQTLLQYVRDELGLTGTKCGCENGECGACTVLMDGRPVRSCLILAAEADGARIQTVEGLATNGELHPLQQSLMDAFAVQCGFCIPGVLMAGTALLEREPHPTESQVMEALGGHLCRCAGYGAMSEAVMIASRSHRYNVDKQ